MKPLTLEETRLKEEMKERCLAKGQYIDEKAKEKFDMLCHLEDFEIQYWELLKENQELNQKYLNAVADYETTMFEKEQLNSLVNSCQEEIRRLKKQLEERPKEYVFIGNAQNKTRDFINQITKDNKEFKNQQKEFIEYMNKTIEELECDDVDDEEMKGYLIQRIDTFKEILLKYKEII